MNNIISLVLKGDPLMISLIILLIVLIIGLFLLFRIIVLWYWKIDKIVELLQKIADNTEKDKDKKE